MSKHTPGPWSALTPDQFGRPVQADWVVAVGDAYICVGPQWDEEYRDESLANARLIAAAPEMLEALKAVMDNESDWKWAQEFGGYVLDDDVREQVRAAIAKAKGKR